MLATIARLVTGTALIVLIACTPPMPASIIAVTIVGGDAVAANWTLTLTATVEVTGNISDAVTWTSSREDVATIDADGHLTGHTAGTTIITATSTADPGKSDSIIITVNPPGTLAWIRVFGTDSHDVAIGIATDAAGNVYATGYTAGALAGSNAGGIDAFVRSYDSAGTLRWTRQFGTSDDDIALAIATDAAGNVYASGYTSGALEGENAGGSDAFIRSFDSAGTLRWTRQFGTSGSDTATGVAIDAAGNVYATGTTTGALDGSNAGGSDAFIRSYDSAGTLRWTRQFGTSGNDHAQGIASDAADNVYAAGYTSGAFEDSEGSSAGGSDGFVRSYDSAGTLRWTRQFSASGDDVARGIASDAAGNVYVAGYTAGAFEGSNAGGGDGFVRSYDSAGILRWTRQFGTSGDDLALGIATDATGDIYVTGSTSGYSGNPGLAAAFLRKYGP